MKLLKNIATVFSVAMFFFNVEAQQNIFVKGYEVTQSLFVKDFELIKTYDKGYMAGNVGFLLKTDSLGNMQFMRQDTFASRYSIDKTYDGGYVCSGWGGIIKLDSTGDIIWFKQFNSITSYSIKTIRETPDSGFILAGGIQLGSYGRAVLIKTDSVGDVQWSYAYKTNIGTGVSFLELTPDNGYLLCCKSSSVINSPNTVDACIIKVDSNGNPVWGKHYAIVGGSFDTRHITATSDGNYIISGGMGGQCLLKIDSAGNQIWMKEYSLPIPSVAQSVEETSDKGFIMGGYLITFGAVLMKTDSMGDFEWVNTLSGSPFGGSVKQTTDGGFVLATRIIGANGHAIGIIKTDSMGLTGTCIDYAPPVTVSNVNDTIISVPVFDSVLSVTTSPVTITFNNVGNVYDLCPTGIQNLQDITEFTLYPNPATTRITLQYNNTANAALQILDITGRRVKQMALSKVSTTTTIDVSDLPAGMYFYSLRTALNKSKTGKFVKE